MEIESKFNKCPCCGSERRFVEEMASEVKEKGWMEKAMNFFALFINGIVKSNNTLIENKIPVGSSVPTYGIGLDACMDCGCIYAVKLVRDEAKKTVPVKLSQPIISKNN